MCKRRVQVKKEVKVEGEKTRSVDVRHQLRESRFIDNGVKDLKPSRSDLYHVTSACSTMPATLKLPHGDTNVACTSPVTVHKPSWLRTQVMTVATPCLALRRFVPLSNFP